MTKCEIKFDRDLKVGVESDLNPQTFQTLPQGFRVSGEGN
jgi:hypothetical protein